MSDYFSIFFVVCVILAIPRWPGVALAVQLFGGPFFSTFLKILGQEGGSGKFALLLLPYATIFIAWRYLRSLKVTLAEVIFGMLVLWLAYTYTDTPSPTYGREKLNGIAFGLAPLLIFARISVSNPVLLKQTIQACGWAAAASVALFMMILLLENHSDSREDGRYDGGFGPLLVAYNSATAIAILLVAQGFVAEPNSKTRRLAELGSWVFIFVGMYLILAAGSRGAFVAVVALFAYWYRSSIFKIRTTVSIVGGVLIIAFCLNYAGGSEGFERITNKLDTSVMSNDGRWQAMEAGLKQFSAYPLSGQGIGSFSKFIGAGDRRAYPHNGFIELAGEGGILALAPMCVLIGMAFYGALKLHRKKLENHKGLLVALLIVGLANFCLSYDLPYQKTIVAAIGIAFGLNQSKAHYATKKYFIQTNGVRSS